MEYYSVLAMMELAVIMVFLVVNLSSRNNKRKNIGFSIISIGIIIGIICSWISLELDENKFDNIYVLNINLHKIVKFIELIILPSLPMICSPRIMEDRNNSTKKEKTKNIFAVIIICIFEAIVLLVLDIYYIDSKNTYHRGSCYSIYIITLLILVAYMFSQIMKLSKYYQSSNKPNFWAILLFFIFGMLMQIANPETNIIWFTVSTFVIYVYIYYKELKQGEDDLTKLLDRNSYNLFFCRKHKREFALIIFDADNFKSINDNLGHLVGDEMLSIIAEILKNQYVKYGWCYRIGGDEFAVILEKKINEIEKINSNFTKALMAKRQEIKELPHVSYGFAIYNPLEDTDIRSVRIKADENMYQYKEKRKSKNK